MQGYGQDAEAYVVVSDDKTTLTFYCDEKRSEWEQNGIKTYGINDKSEIDLNYPAWHTNIRLNGNGYSEHQDNDFETVIFHSSFANARPNSCAFWFHCSPKLRKIEGINYLNTEAVTSMINMFSGCKTLENLDVSNFDTKEVTDMAHMFNDCEKIQSLNVSKFDTQKVTDMQQMFHGCKSLEKLDLSNFNTQEVISMYWMFGGCSDLKELIFGNTVITSKVTKMESMFSGCSSLLNLDLSSFATPSLTYMTEMFYGCENLQTIDISNFITSSVTRMGSMFMECKNLTKIITGDGWTTKYVEYMYQMFCGCEKYNSADFVSKFETQNVVDMSDMFNNNMALTKLDLSNFDTQKVKNMHIMFGGCENLDTIIIDTEKFSTKNVSDMSGMFMHCKKLAYIDLSKFDTEKVESMYGMFYGCDGFTVLDLSNFDTHFVEDIRGMFAYCDNLTTIIVGSDWDNSKFQDERNDESPFYKAVNLIGNNGISYTEDKISSKYARIDNGYLTTDSYKIFYDLNGGEWDGEQGANEFALSGRTEDIIIPYPKKAGFIFDGWTGTLASGLSDTQPIKDVSITTDQKGNRRYTAHWKNVDENEIEISYPQTDQEREVYCDLHQDKSITLELNPNEIRDEYYYQIAIEELNRNIEGNSFYNNSGYEIPITLPATLTSNEYTGSINLFSSSDAKEPILKYKLTIKLLMPQNLILHLYEDVIFVSNGDSLYNPYKWQWYKNGQPINGATRQYIYDNEMSGNTYMCKMQTKDGLEVYTCPFTEPSLTKSLSQSVTIAPNPASEGEPTNVKIANFDPETDYTITISNSNGVVVRTIYHANENNTINLNRGIYSGALIFNGNKKGFKLIVR
ncbi:MAG: BspA family leucine-rich repeat surface protein [Bacteroidales bacterium]|nr:BspA family leucine-rich repeat surface protein [Bacteroidales bacterium]